MERIESLDSAISERRKSSESSREGNEIARRTAGYAIGHLRLDPARGTLTHGSRPLALGPRVIATLAALVERGGEVCTKDELLERVWLTADVAESNVAQSVYLLRKVFREEGLGNPIATSRAAAIAGRVSFGRSPKASSPAETCSQLPSRQTGGAQTRRKRLAPWR